MIDKQKKSYLKRLSSLDWLKCYRFLATFDFSSNFGMNWWLITLILCSFGIFKEFRPTEPYLYNYQHEDLNITDEDLNGKVYPLWTYSYLVALVPALLLTDVFLYKPVLIFESICYITVWLTLIFGQSVFSQQVGQCVYGFATATEVAYFAYIYVKVDRKNYSKFIFFIFWMIFNAILELQRGLALHCWPANVSATF